LDTRWQTLLKIIEPNADEITSFVKGACFKISGSFDRISLLFEKCEPSEREKRFDRLHNLFDLKDDEKWVFKSFATFMKLHGWEQPSDTLQATPASRRKSEVKITNWVIGYLDEKEKFRSDFKLKGITDFAEQFSKFKKEANFANLENMTGFLVSHANSNFTNLKSNFQEVAYFELPTSGYMRANTIFKDLITSILENGTLLEIPNATGIQARKLNETFEFAIWLNSKSPEIQKAIVGKLDNIFMQRYPVYYMKDDAVRFGPSLSEMSAVQNYVSPNSVRKWRETANEQLADIKRDIASLPDRPSNPEPATKKSQVESDVKAVNEKTVHPIKQEKSKSTLELPSTSQKSQSTSNQNQSFQQKSSPARPPSAVPYDVPNFQNQDDVNLYIATLISENEALKKDLSLTAQKWQSVQENKKIKVQTLPDDPPSVKRSQSFQSTKSDEKDIRIKELEKQLAKAKEHEDKLWRDTEKFKETIQKKDTELRRNEDAKRKMAADLKTKLQEKEREFQKYKDDILKFIDDIDGLEKEIAERDNVLRQNSAIIENQKTKINQLQQELQKANMKAETAQSQAKAENKTLQNLVQQFYKLNASEVQTVDKKSELLHIAAETGLIEDPILPKLNEVQDLRVKLEKMKMRMGFAEESQEAKTNCTICEEMYDSEENRMVTLAPCGHCLCFSCAKRCMPYGFAGACPHCRKEFKQNQIITLYFA